MRTDPFSPEQVARICYAALRQLREEQGCSRGPVWGLLTKAEQLWYVQCVERARMGMLPAQIHQAWLDDMTEDGWSCAPDIDHVKKTHPELAQWEDLDGKYRRRFIVMQMWAAALGMDVPSVWSGSGSVTAM